MSFFIFKNYVSAAGAYPAALSYVKGGHGKRKKIFIDRLIRKEGIVGIL